MFALIVAAGSTGMDSGSSWLSDWRLVNMPVTVPHSEVDLKLIIISEHFFVFTLEVQ